MNIGMMWYFDSKKLSLEGALRQALDYYKHKYKQTPNRCFVNPYVVESETDMGGVKVTPLKYMLANHLWLGVEDVQRT